VSKWELFPQFPVARSPNPSSSSALAPARYRTICSASTDLGCTMQILVVIALAIIALLLTSTNAR
jgi:hypothetical protein